MKAAAWIGVIALWAAPAHAQAQKPMSFDLNQIAATARSHLTPRGADWAKGEGARLRRGEIDAVQVEKDAAAVPNGLTQGADVDELVLIALLAAGGESGSPARARADMNGGVAPDRTSAADLNAAIANVAQKLHDTQQAASGRH
jgi:hypothetical protein